MISRRWAVIMICPADVQMFSNCSIDSLGKKKRQKINAMGVKGLEMLLNTYIEFF